MPEPRYRAFLSYSHRDKDIGEAIHRALETYTVPRELVGKKADHGEIPAKMHPIFRDRYDLEAGHSLHHQVSEALRASDALIVLCSPASAKSKYVGGEIRAFKALGRAERIYPVIIGGEPGDPERECFNPALRYKVDQDGQLTNEPEEPLAADWRAEGDGPDLAKLKLIAGLIGVDLDHLRRREAEEQKRQNRRWMMVAASMAGLAVVASIASFAAWRESERNGRMLERTIKTTSNLIETAIGAGGEFGVPTRVSLRFLTVADQIFTDMDELQIRSDKLDLRRTELQMTFSESYSKLGRVGDQMKAARAALDAARGLVKREPDKLSHQAALANAHLRLGRAYSIRRELARALVSYTDALEVHEKHLAGRKATSREALEILSDIYQSISLTRYWRDEYLTATDAAEAGLAVAERLAGIAGSQVAARRLITALTALADIRRARKDPHSALVLADRAMLVARDDLARTPDGVAEQLRVASLHLVRGDALAAQGERRAALTAYTDCHQIRQRLHEEDPQNRFIGEETAFALVKIGEMQVALGDAQAAVTFLAARDAFERMLQADPDNVSSASLLVHALDGHAEILRRQGKHEQAGATHVRKIELATRILAKDPENRDSQRLLAKSYLAHGTNLAALGQHAAALEVFDRAIAVRRPMIDAAMTDLTPQQLINDERGLAEGLEKSGEIDARLNRIPAALAFFDEALALRRKHRAAMPDDAVVGQRFAATLERTATALARLDKLPQAMPLLAEAIAVRKTLHQSDEQKRLTAVLLERLGEAHRQTGDVRAALAVLTESLALRAGLHAAIAASAGLNAAQVTRNLGETHRLIAIAHHALGDCAAAAASIAVTQRHLAQAIAMQPANTGWIDQARAAADIAQQISTACTTGAVNAALPAPATPAQAGDAIPAAEDDGR